MPQLPTQLIYIHFIFKFLQRGTATVSQSNLYSVPAFAGTFYSTDSKCQIFTYAYWCGLTLLCFLVCNYRTSLAIWGSFDPNNNSCLSQQYHFSWSLNKTHNNPSTQEMIILTDQITKTSNSLATEATDHSSSFLLPLKLNATNLPS